MSKREIIESELRAIWDQRGRLLPDDVLEIAANDDHPLHEFFEWDDTDAARRFRLDQARGLIRSVKLKVTTVTALGDVEDIKIRYWLPARGAGAASPVPEGYMPEDVVRQSPELREALLRQMQRDLTTFRRRYQHLAEFWNKVSELAAEAQSGAA